MTASFPPDGDHLISRPRRRRSREPEPPKPIGPVALIGVAGEFIDLVAPQSEADPAAILSTLLVYVGNAVGRGPHFVVDGVRHGCNLNVLIVGATSQGRKGTSEAWPRRLLELADPEWAGQCIASGLSSGEGLIHHLRDPVQVGTDKASGEAIMDAGVNDKRVTAVESEFSRTLRVIRRDGNTLVDILRLAWDGANLRVITKSPVTATGAHVSVLGHVVQQELLAQMTDASIFGGTMNRFLCVSAKRQRQLPFGGNITTEHLRPIAERLRQHLYNARATAGEMAMTATAKVAWPELYSRLVKSEQRAGLAGALLGRAIPQVRRLAMIFAICDGSRTVDCRHLDAAAEVWRYCEESVLFVFGERTGNLIADRLLDEIRSVGSDGLDRTAARKAVGGRPTGSEIDRALDLLERLGRALCVMNTQTGGRPSEVWYPAVEGDR